MTMSKTREGEQVFPSLSYEGDHMDDPGYVDYNDQRLVPPDVNDTEEEDMPLTAELREVLDLLDVDYSCGWDIVRGETVNAHDTTHVTLGGNRLATVEEVEGNLYVEFDENTTFTPYEVALMMVVARRHGA